MPLYSFQRSRVEAARLSETVLAKWPKDLLQEGYVPLPKRVLRALSGLFPGQEAVEELLVLLAAADFRRPNLKQIPSLDFLAYTAGLTPDVFGRALRRLEKKGFVTREGTDDDNLELNNDPLFAKVREVAPEGE